MKERVMRKLVELLSLAGPFAVALLSAAPLVGNSGV